MLYTCCLALTESKNKLRINKTVICTVTSGRIASVTTYSFFFLLLQALNFLVESFGLLNDLFPLPSILDAGYPVFDLHLADVLFDVILPSVVGSSL